MMMCVAERPRGPQRQLFVRRVEYVLKTTPDS
jgi:hypothetical protein